MDDCYGFGDSNNDIEMMRTVAHSIAMGNGAQNIKDMCEYVTTSADEDGIYNALVHYGLIEG